MDRPSLYQRLLGQDFARLPGALQRFYSAPGGGHATGFMDITTGRGPLLRSLARLLKFPHPGHSVPVDLQVGVRGEMEIWTRQMGNERFVSFQWARDGLLMERTGPLLFAFRLAVIENGMSFECIQNRLGPVGLPRPLALHVTATALAGTRENEWEVSVQVYSGLVGKLLKYTGQVTLLEDEQAKS